MIWRRLLVCGDSTIADLHYIVQIAMGWSDNHLHQFRIHGKRYGIDRLGGICFSDDPDCVRLKDLGLRINERFFYEYDFTDNWQHLIRVEAFLAPDPHRHYPVCIDGRRACPPEDCGGPWRFMALRQHYCRYHIMERLLEIIEEGGSQDYHDWFHITIRITVMCQSCEQANGEKATDALESAESPLAASGSHPRSR